MNVSEELKGLVVGRNNSVRFLDDLFMLSKQQMESFWRILDHNDVPIFPWEANGRANIIAKFDDNFISYLKERGAYQIAIGIESGSERLRRMIRKQVTWEEIDASIAKLISSKIRVKGFFMIGLPTETTQETDLTLEIARKLTVQNDGMFYPSIFVFRPYPGTVEWQRLLSHGYTENQLLQMEAEFDDSRRANTMVTPNVQFAEDRPNKLNQKLREFNLWLEENFRI